MQAADPSSTTRPDASYGAGSGSLRSRHTLCSPASIREAACYWPAGWRHIIERTRLRKPSFGLMSRRERIFCLVIGMRASSLIAVMRRKPTSVIVERALRPLAGADNICASGDCGRIIGSIHDHAVLERYAQTRTWCPVENQFFVDFFA